MWFSFFFFFPLDINDPFTPGTELLKICPLPLNNWPLNIFSFISLSLVPHWLFSVIHDVHSYHSHSFAVQSQKDLCHLDPGAIIPLIILAQNGSSHGTFLPHLWLQRETNACPRKCRWASSNCRGNTLERHKQEHKDASPACIR